jgi:hypothetical protein
MHYPPPGRDSAPYDLPCTALPFINQAHHHIPARDHRHYITHRRVQISSQVPRHADAYSLCMHPPDVCFPALHRTRRHGGLISLANGGPHQQAILACTRRAGICRSSLPCTPLGVCKHGHSLRRHVCPCLVLNLDTKYVHVRLPSASKDANPTISM